MIIRVEIRNFPNYFTFRKGNAFRGFGKAAAMRPKTKKRLPLAAKGKRLLGNNFQKIQVAESISKLMK